MGLSKRSRLKKGCPLIGDPGIHTVSFSERWDKNHIF